MKPGDLVTIRPDGGHNNEPILTIPLYRSMDTAQFHRCGRLMEGEVALVIATVPETDPNDDTRALLLSPRSELGWSYAWYLRETGT